MTKTETKKPRKKNPNSGGARNVRPPELKRVPLFATVSPETKKLLEPFAARSETGKIIDAAIAAYLKNY